MGIDLETALSNAAQTAEDTGAPASDFNVVEALVRNDLARQLAGPRLMTMSGRSAVFDIGGDAGGTKLKLTPKILDSGEIRVDVSLDLTEKATGTTSSQFALTATTDVQPGQPHCLARVATRHPGKKGDVQDYCTVVILTADTKPPKEVQVGTTPPRIEEANATSTVSPQRQ